MQLYVVLRRDGWQTANALRAAAAASGHVSGRMDDRVRWIRSYVIEEPGGGLGTLCIYLGASAEAIREHTERAGLPVDEIAPVSDTMIGRPDPLPLALAA